MQGLSRLVNDVQVLRAAWERETVVSTALGDFEDVLTVESLESLIETSLPLPAGRLFREGEFLPESLMIRPPDRRGRNAKRLSDAQRTFGQIRAGATLAVEELQLYDPAVAALTTAVERETGYSVDSTAFLTPAGATGAAPHRDPVSFFLRQVHGTKRWRVWPAEEGPVADRPHPGVFARTAPELDVLLKEGDCIYIPRGRVHLGETLDEASVHLSIGVWHDTWAQALIKLITVCAATDSELNELLPPRFSPTDRDDELCERDDELRERLARLTDRLAGASWSMIDPGPAPVEARLSLSQALDRRDRRGQSQPRTPPPVRLDEAEIRREAI